MGTSTGIPVLYTNAISGSSVQRLYPICQYPHLTLYETGMQSLGNYDFQFRDRELWEFKIHPYRLSISYGICVVMLLYQKASIPKQARGFNLA